MNQKVTHQGSTPKRLRDLLEIRLIQFEKANSPSFPGIGMYCHHCGAVCEPFLRHEFLRSTQFKRAFRRH
jgi:hypothetical protein